MTVATLNPPVRTNQNAITDGNFITDSRQQIADGAKTNSSALQSTRTTTNSGEQTRIPDVSRNPTAPNEQLGVDTGQTAAETATVMQTELNALDTHPNLRQPNTSPDTSEGDSGTGGAGAPGSLGSGVREPNGEPKKGATNDDDDLNQRPGETPAAWEIRIKDRLKTVFGKSGSGWTSKLLILGGLSIGVYTAIMLARFDGTNSNVRVLKVTIEKFSTTVSGFKKVTVEYDRSTAQARPPAAPTTPVDKNAFNPCRGDVVSFDGMAGFESGHEFRVMDSGINTVILKVSDARLNGFTTLAANAYDPADLTASSNYVYNAGDDSNENSQNDIMKVYTTMGNQVADSISGGLDLLALLAEELAAAAVNVILAGAGAAAGAASAGFCNMVPLLCDGTIWIIIGMILAALVVFIILN